MKLLAVVRVRGVVTASQKVIDTLKMLRLHRTNYATLVKDTPSYLGMLRKAKDYITWGEIDKETLKELIVKKLRITGDKKINEELLKKYGFKNLDEFIEKLHKCKVDLRDFKEIKPFFRLRPPSKGYKSIKHPWPRGALGYRGNAINDLIRRML